MKRDPLALERDPFDLVVVGGGIFGACAALDAALRGMSVVLIDRGDFCSATSAQSFKLVHGGLRYLQHLDIRRVRHSSLARRTLLRAAPHLVHPLPVVVPTYGHGMKGRGALRAAIAAYDALTWDRNREIADLSRHVPRSYSLSRREVLDRYPGVDARGLTGAAVFHDAQMYNPPRLVLAYVRSAAQAGAQLANYVAAESVEVRQGQVQAVHARDLESGAPIVIRTRAVLNAAGPWAEMLLKHGLNLKLDKPTYWSRDAYFVVDRNLVPPPNALALPSRSRVRDTILSRGHRHLFLVPWRHYTLVGVWHKVYHGDPDAYRIDPEERHEFAAEINAFYPGFEITPANISMWNAGLIPFGENLADAEAHRFGKRSRMIDHRRSHRVNGLVTLIGSRFTTGPSDAANAIDVIGGMSGLRLRGSQLHAVTAYGGDVSDFAQLVSNIHDESKAPLDVSQATALAHNHGSQYGKVLSLVSAEPELGKPMGLPTVLCAEAVLGVRQEMAQHLTDVVFRRTDLATGQYPARETLQQCARLVGAELGWTDEQAAHEVELVESSMPEGVGPRPSTAAASSAYESASPPV